MNFLDRNIWKSLTNGLLCIEGFLELGFRLLPCKFKRRKDCPSGRFNKILRGEGWRDLIEN